MVIPIKICVRLPSSVVIRDVHKRICIFILRFAHLFKFLGIAINFNAVCCELILNQQRGISLS